MDGFFDLIVLVLELDDFGVGKDKEPIGMKWSGEEGFGFLMDLFQEGFQLIGGIAQAQGLHGAQSGFETSGAQEDVLQELLISVGEITLVFWQKGWIEALAGAGDFHLDRRGAQVKGTFRCVAIGAIAGLEKPG